jgi:site-specific DNA recombinase
VIAAIYARKSTEQAGAGDKSESVERQLAHARAYATKKGWAIADAHAYSDDGISGAEFGDRRPGLARLLNALRPRPPFQVLVMSEESRLGRESIEVAYALKTFAQAGVRVFLYLEDRERTIDSPTEKLLMNVAAFADELERERARQRTYDAMARKARALHVTGGRVYGYDNVDVDGADGRRLHVVRRVNEEQAAVVRRIFALCAEGHGFTRIAKALNEDGVAPPRRASGWAPTAIREILLRPLYRGEVIWNRQQKRDRWGVKKYLDRPEAEWIQLEAPELRIVDEEVWQAAHRRLDRTRALYAGTGGRPPLDRGANPRAWRPQRAEYLLSGIAKCAECGGSLVAFTRDMKSGERRALYGCMYHHKRGAKVCRNPILIRQERRLDRVVLEAIAEALDERILERAVEKAAAKLSGRRRAVPERRAQLERDLADVEARIQRGLEALLAGTEAADELRARLKVEKDRKAALAAELEALRKGRNVVAELDDKRLLQELRARVRDVRMVLGQDIPRTRQILRKLLVGRLECRAFDEGGRIGYRFTGQGSYTELMPGGAFNACGDPGGIRTRDLDLERVAS